MVVLHVTEMAEYRIHEHARWLYDNRTSGTSIANVTDMTGSVCMFLSCKNTVAIVIVEVVVGKAINVIVAITVLVMSLSPLPSQ